MSVAGLTRWERRERRERRVAVAVAVAVLLFVALAAAPEDVPANPALVKMVAVQATNEGRGSKYFGEGLEGVRKSVIGLDYDTFHRVKATEKAAPYGLETKLPIDGRYTLCLTPVSVGADGRIRLKTRITMTSRNPERGTINALDTTLVMVPGKPINLGGLKLDIGELIVVLRVS